VKIFCPLCCEGEGTGFDAAVAKLFQPRAIRHGDSNKIWIHRCHFYTILLIFF